MKKSLMLSTVILTLGLAGCAGGHAKLEQDIADLNMKLDNLASKVDSLADGQAALRSDVAAATAAANDAKSEAARANDRIDNMVSSYKK